jgi:hypothetical protein
VIGFFMGAYGKTRTVLAFVLVSGALFFLLTPVFDTSALIFFWMMFFLSVLFACTDVAVNRATVIAGDDESKATGRSRAATIGVNQAICWAAIYGTSIIAAFFDGWVVDNIKIDYLMVALAIILIAVLLVAIRLPRDTAASIPIKISISNFWNGLNTGPVVWIILFYFLFHFQPTMGPCGPII